MNEFIKIKSMQQVFFSDFQIINWLKDQTNCTSTASKVYNFVKKNNPPKNDKNKK